MRPRTKAQLADPVRVAKALANPANRPRVLREQLRELVGQHIDLLDSLIRDQTQDAEVRLQALKLALQFGLGTNQNLTTGEDENQAVAPAVIALPELDMGGLQRERLQEQDARRAATAPHLGIVRGEQG